MIKTLFRKEVPTKVLYLLNQPFEVLLDQDLPDDTCHSGRTSSYHEKDAAKGIWRSYVFLQGPLEVVVAKADENMTALECYNLMKENGGFSLSRNNLFSLYHYVFCDEIKKYLKQNLNDKKFSKMSICAPTKIEYLPNHLNGPSITPMFEFVMENFRVHLDYDWMWTDDPRMTVDCFAFFKPVIPKLSLFGM